MPLLCMVGQVKSHIALGNLDTARARIHDVRLFEGDDEIVEILEGELERASR